MEPSVITDSDNIYVNKRNQLTTRISGKCQDSLTGNILIRVSELKEAASRELERKVEQHSTVNTMIEFTKCSSPYVCNSQETPLDFSVKRRASFSGSLTDDSQTSSSSPGHTTDSSMLSPSTDPIQVDDSTSIARWRTPGSDASDDHTPFEQTKPVASPVPQPGLLCNFGLFPGSLVNHLTNDSEMNTFSQIAGVIFDKCNNKGGSLLKQYPNESLQMPLGFLGIAGPPPNVVHNGIDMGLLMGVNTKNILHMYQQQLQRVKTAELSARFATQSSVSSLSSGKQLYVQQKNHDYIRIPPTATCSNVSPQVNRNPSPGVTLHARNSPGVTVSTPASKTSSLAHSNSRKRACSLPDDQKDDAYWERRRKNNDAAKRSRDARRAKEEEIAVRATFLEQENLKLREEVALLRTETHRLRHMLYSN